MEPGDRPRGTSRTGEPSEVETENHEKTQVEAREVLSRKTTRDAKTTGETESIASVVAHIPAPL